jgi:L-fucose isomerase-like protein
MERPKLAFVGFGEINTPIEIIKSKCSQAIQWLNTAGLQVVSTDPVCDDPEGKTVQRAITELKGSDVDVLIACVAGWIPSHTVIRLLSEFQHLPIILWGLSGRTEDQRLITTADQAGTTALRQTLEDLNFNFRYFPNYQDATPRVEEIVRTAQAAMALRRLRTWKVGMMGNRDMNLYNTLYDGISLRQQLGVEIEFFEMLEMVQRSEAIPTPEVDLVRKMVFDKWNFDHQPDDKVLEKGIRYYLSIRTILEEKRFQAISLIDVDGMKKLLHFPPAMVFMLLADEAGVCTIPENDALGAVTQLMVRALTGQIAAYLEFYEFFSNGVLIGVPDFVPSEVVEGPVRVCPSSFGSLAGGLLNVSTLKTGPVTLCRLARRRGEYVLHLVEGMAETPRAWEEAGWTPPAPQLPGLRFVLSGDMEAFSENVMGQHYIISYGSNKGLLKEFCRLARIRVIE